MEKLAWSKFLPDNDPFGSQAFSLDEQERVPFPTRRGTNPESPAPRNLDPKPTKDRMMDRMRKVDPKQSERYRQRTGE
ncbi:MAG: ubiquitin-like protein UBact [Nitrospiraceae bacterium]|nr:ubiquitin-like protein UBact [Nitrospirota bacterium]MDA8149752.1 ubiquitin-like protein UBact [Nitrospiraceae bacterium]